MSNFSEQISAVMQPVIITYNRSVQLRKTLQAFSESKLNEMILHIIDNASTDETQQVVSEMRANLPKLVYHRNIYNIGGNANILRSVEVTNSYYHWVIGDDDAWLLNSETLQELADVLLAREADIVRLGWLASDATRGQLLPARALVANEMMFFASLSMISATILKRSIVDKYLPQSYQNITDSYPQLVAPICAVEQDEIRVYTMQKDLMTHMPSQEPGYFAGDFEWYAGWYRTSRFFSNKTFKKKFVREISYYMCRRQPGLMREQAYQIKVLLYYKSFGMNQWPYLLSMLAYGSGRRMSVSLLMLINLFTPVIILSALRNCYFKLKRMPPKTVRVDRSRL